MKHNMKRLLIIALLLAGCSESGDPIVAARNTIVELRTISVDQFRLKVVEDGTVLTDSLTAPDGVISIPVKYFENEHRYQVYNVFENILLIDTIVTYKPGLQNGVTFFQAVAEGKLQWVGPPENEALAPEGYTKISIIYTYPAMPDEVEVVVQNSVDGGTSYATTDTFILQKGTFSPYFQIRNSTSRARITMYINDGTRQKVAELGSIVNANADFSVFLFRSSSNSSAPYNLDPDKLY